jgi:hypothetical protein
VLGSERPTGVHVVGPALAGSLLGLAVGVSALLVLLVPALQASALVPGAARADDVLLVLMAWVGVGLAGWLAAGSLLGVLALLPGTTGRVAGEVAERLTPLAVRRLLTFTLGAAVGSCALPAAPVASAATAPAGRTSVAPAPQPANDELVPGYAPTVAQAAGPKAAGPKAGARTRLDDGPGFLPTLEPLDGKRVDPPALAGSASGASAPALTRGPGYLPSAPPRVHDADGPRLLVPAPRLASSTHELVTVRRGDSLWSIASRHLGSGASDVQVAREWPRWYAANRDLIGDDPDLLVPGQQLRPPTSSGTSSRDSGTREVANALTPGSAR